MGGGVPEALDLLILRRQIHDRIPDHVDNPERPIDPGRGGVANCHADERGARLGLQVLDHGGGEINPVDPYTPLTQWQCDTTGANTEFERGTVSGEVGEETNSRVKDVRLEHV